jgi:hypothetical protein
MSAGLPQCTRVGVLPFWFIIWLTGHFFVLYHLGKLGPDFLTRSAHLAQGGGWGGHSFVRLHLTCHALMCS